MRTNRHVPKTQKERREFAKAIRQAEYEPTIDEAPDFHNSDEISPDEILQKDEARTRPLGIGKKAWNIITQNQVAIFLTLLAIFITCITSLY